MYEDDFDELDFSSLGSDSFGSDFSSSPSGEPDFSSLGFDNPGFDDTASPAEMAREDSADDDSFWSDMGNMFMRGSAGVAKSAGWLLDKVGFDAAGDSLSGIAENAIDYWDSRVSDDAKSELQKEFVSVAEGGDWWNPLDWERGEAGIEKAALMTSESLTGTFAGMGVGAGIAKPLNWVINKFANPLGVASLQKAAEMGKKAYAAGASKTDEIVLAGQRADKYLKFINGTVGGVSYGAGEGLVAAGMAGSSVHERVMMMPHEALMERSSKYPEYYNATEGLGLSEEERIKQAKSYIADQASSKAGWEAGITTAILGAPTGALFGRVLGPIKTVDGAAKTAARAYLRGTAIEAAQEAPQSAAEQALSNRAIQEYADEEQAIGEGVFDAAISGAIAGGLLGGPFGLGEGAGARAEDQAEQANETLLEQDRIRQQGAKTITSLLRRGFSEEQALRMVDPIIRRMADSQDYVSAFTDLRYIEENGEPRQKEDWKQDEKPLGLDEATKAGLIQGMETPEQGSSLLKDDQNVTSTTIDIQGEKDPYSDEELERVRGESAETKSAADAAYEAWEDSEDPDDIGSEQAKAMYATAVSAFEAAVEVDRVEYIRGRMRNGDSRKEAEAKYEDYRQRVLESKENAAANHPLQRLDRATREAAEVALENEANQAATSPENNLPEPTEGQQSAGNYKKGHVRHMGHDISIENPSGSTRHGIKLKDHYGYIRGTVGADGDHIDAFIGTSGDGIFVIETNNADGEFDEHKVMMGYASEEEAIAAFNRNYDDSRDRIISVQQMDRSEFKQWTKDTTAKYKTESSGREYPMAPEGTWYSDGDYKQRGGRIVEMSPDEYLGKVRALEIDEVSRDNIDDLKNTITSGGELDPLKIYPDGSEDGRHRAHAAKELGIETVPVMVFDKQEDGAQTSETTREEVTRETSETEGVQSSRLQEESGGEPERAEVLPEVSQAEDEGVAEEQPDQASETGEGAGTDQGERPRPRFSLREDEEGSGAKRLNGISAEFDVDGQSVEFGFFGPAVQAAVTYSANKGFEYVPLTEYAEVDEERAAKIAAEYEVMEDNPDDPEVRAAYEAMIAETLEQYQVMLDTGLVVEFIKGDDPYGNPRNAILDVVNNNHLYVFSTADGFGSLNEASEGNLLLQPTEFKDANGQVMLANDVFRAVHDYFGHIKNGVGFRARGEENAWQAHAAMYSPLARRAMTVETRGQNSWVNFGPHAEHNRTASPGDTIYADQKIGLLPIWVSEEGRLSERNRQTDPRYREGLEGAIVSDRVILTHYSKQGIDRTDPSRAGTGADRGVRRWTPKVTYFGITEANENGYRKESVVAPFSPVENFASLPATSLYPADVDPENLWDHDNYEATIQALKDAGFSGYWSDNPQLGKVAVVWDPLQIEDSKALGTGEDKAQKPLSEKAREAARARIQEVNRRRAERKELLEDLNNPSPSIRETGADVAGAEGQDEEQEAMIEWAIKGVGSKYFKRWFGKSKTVDQWGTPIRFYHGTKFADEVLEEGFDTETSRGSSKALFFSTDPGFASDWSLLPKGDRTVDDPSAVIPVYIRAEKIFDYESPKMVRSLKRWLAKDEAFLSEQGYGKEDLDRFIDSIRNGYFGAVEYPSVQKFMKDRGYEAFWVHEDGRKNIGVFDPRNVKSATGNIGTFDSSSSNIRFSLKAPETEEIFYSAVAMWVEQFFPKETTTKTAEEVITKLTGKNPPPGIKKEELEDMGLVPWLKSRSSSEKLTRKEFLRFIENNQVQFREFEYRSAGLLGPMNDREFNLGNAELQKDYMINTYIPKALVEAGMDYGQATTVAGMVESDGVTEALSEYLDPITLKNIIVQWDATMFDLWQAEHVETDRFPRSRADKIIHLSGSGYHHYTMLGSEISYRDGYAEFLMKLPAIMDQHGVPVDRKNFRTHHWAELNVMLHFRVWRDFDSSSGVNTLVVEEFQSDWHQMGRQRGYERRHDPVTGAVPDAPMKANYHMLALKRFIRYAAENGFDRVVWPSGEEIAARFDPVQLLGENIELARRMNEDGSGRPYYMLYTENSPNGGAWEPEWRMDLMLSKEIREKLTAQMTEPNDNVSANIKGMWEGRGVTNYYDNLFQKPANKYLKKYGSKIERASFTIQQTGETKKVWSFEMTDQLKELAMRGQPLYSLSEGVGAEFNRRMELYQLAQYADSKLRPNMRPKVIQRYLLEGVERGLYSPDILIHSGVLDGKVITDTTKVLMQIRKRIRGNPITQRHSMTKRLIQQEVRRMAQGWKDAPKTVVHESWESLPVHIRSEVEQSGFHKMVEGVMDVSDGTVHIVAANIQTMERLHRVFTEESLGHFGLRKFFGGQLDDFLLSVAPQMEGSEAWNSLLGRYRHLAQGLQSSNPSEQREARLAVAEELLAKMDVDQGVWEKFVSWVRQWLRDRGLITNYTENDLRRIMSMVHDRVKNGTIPRGERNNTTAVRNNGLRYSLYGGTLDSSLELALRNEHPGQKAGNLSKFNEKTTPKNFLNQLRGNQEKDGWPGGTDASRAAASKTGIPERELEMSGIIGWLKEQNTKNPKVSVTVDQLIEVFHERKPKIIAVSRGTQYLFPPIEPRYLFHVRRDSSGNVITYSDTNFDQKRAESEMGYFSDYINGVINDQDALRDLIQGVSRHYENKKWDENGMFTTTGGYEVSFSGLVAQMLVQNPFGNRIPEWSIYKSVYGDRWGEAVAKDLGLKSLTAPITTENINPDVKMWISREILRDIENKGGYRNYTFILTPEIAGKQASDIAGQFGFSTDRDGKIDSIWRQNEGGKNKEVADEIAEYLNEQLPFIAEAAEDYVEEKALELGYSPSARSVYDTHRAEREMVWRRDFFLTEVRAIGSRKAEEVITRKVREGAIDNTSMKDVFGDAVSYTGSTELFSPDSSRTGHNPFDASLWESYTFSGGTNMDVVSIQLYGGEEAPSKGHYSSKDVVHIRVKTRMVGEKKYLGIEEIQSDWVSNVRDRNLSVDQMEGLVRAGGSEFISTMDAFIGYVENHPWNNIFRGGDRFDVWVNNGTAGSILNSLVNSSMASNLFLDHIASRGEDEKRVVSEVKKYISEFKALQPEGPRHPWFSSWVDLAMNTMVAWAMENDYDGVAWPQGEYVAMLYGDDSIAGRVNSFTVNLGSGAMAGLRFSDEALYTDMFESINHSSDGQQIGTSRGGTRNVSYLDEAIGQAKGVDKENLIQVKSLVESLLSEGDDVAGRQAIEDAVKDIEDITVVDGNRILVRLYDDTIWNGRLHRILYNTMAPKAATSVAKEVGPSNKKSALKYSPVKMEGVGGKTEHTLVKKRKKVVKEAEAEAPQAPTWPRVDWNDMVDFDAVGYNRESATKNILIDFYGTEGTTMTMNVSRVLAGRTSSETRVIQNYYNDELMSFLGREEVDSSQFYTGNESLKIQPTYVRTITSQDLDDISPWVFEIDFANEQGEHVFTLPLRRDDMSNNEPISTTSMSELGAFYVSDLLGTVGYDIMKNVWGIENPNPLVLKNVLNTYITSIYEQLQDAWIRTGVGANVSRTITDSINIWDGFDRQEQQDQPEYISDNSEQEIDYTGEDFIEVDIIPNPEALEFAKRNADIRTDFEAANVISMVPFKRRDEVSEVKRKLLAGEYKGISDEWTKDLPGVTQPESHSDFMNNMFTITNAMVDADKEIPVTWHPRRSTFNGEKVKKEMFPATTTPQDLSKYIEYKDQDYNIWHSISFNKEHFPNARKPRVPFSLRRSPKGNDSSLAIINKKMMKPESELTILDRVTDWLSRMTDAIKTDDLAWGIRQGLLDSGASVKRWERKIFGNVLDASQSPYKMLNMTRNLPSVMAAIAKAGVPAMQGGAFQPVEGRKGFIDILRPLYEHKDGDLSELWSGYAAARRASQLITQQNPDGTSREKLFTQKEIDELLKLGDKYPVFKTVFEDWNEFNAQVLNLAVEHGVLSKAEREAWAQNDYVPFYRATEEVAGVDQRTGVGRVKKGVSGQHHGIKRLYGTDKPLGNVIENMWYNTATLIDRVYKNEAMTRIVNMMEGIGMEAVPMPMEAVNIPVEQLARALGKAGLLVGNPSKGGDNVLKVSGASGTPSDWIKAVEKMTPEQRLKWATVFRPTRPVGDNIVSVMREGRLVYYEVQDELLLSTLNGMTAEGLAGLMSAMGISKNLLTRMITIDPGFMLANWMRDTLSSWVTSEANVIPVADSIASIGDIATESGTYLKMMMAGAGGGGFYDLTAGKVSKEMEMMQNRGVKAWLPKAWRGYMKIGAISENSNRIAIANRVLKRGGTAAEAMHQAQDIMNFTMSGDYPAVRFLIRTVPFLNARLQGLYRLGRGAKEHPVGFALKGLILTAVSLALLARNFEDDDYERLEEWQKDLNWNFFVDGIHYTIPKPFEVGLIFGTFPERIARAMLGRDDLSVSKERLLSAFSETLAFNPIPQLFKPMYEQGANINLFTGQPIVNMAMSGLEYPYQASPWTSEVAKGISSVVPEWMGPAQSPLRIEHAIRAYLGTMGLYALDSVDWVVQQARDDLPEKPSRRWYEKPVISRVVKGEAATSRYNKYTDRLYKAIEESNKARRTINNELKSGRLEEARELAAERQDLLGPNREALNEAMKYMRDFSAQGRAIMLSKKFTAEEKRQKLDDLNVKRNQLLERVAPLLDDLQFED